MLYEMTFAQLLAMVETRNSRELRAHEEAERQARLRENNPNYIPPPKKDLTAPENLPSVSDVSRIFGGLM